MYTYSVPGYVTPFVKDEEVEDEAADIGFKITMAELLTLRSRVKEVVETCIDNYLEELYDRLNEVE